jgi:hypothetical protein
MNNPKLTESHFLAVSREMKKDIRTLFAHGELNDILRQVIAQEIQKKKANKS